MVNPTCSNQCPFSCNQGTVACGGSVAYVESILIHLNSSVISTTDYRQYTGNSNRTGTYTVNGLNQYTAVSGASVSYDNNGNLTNDNGAIYQYDDENRLRSTSGVGIASSTLKYDPLGRLYEIIINGSAVTRFLYDGDALVAEYNGAGTMTRRYVHGDQVDEPLVQYNLPTSTPRYLHADHQGSIIAHSDTSGALLTALSYDAYGIPKASNTDRFGYTGQAWIAELGLYHYKARMYSPRLGRFLQTDPIYYADNMNMYAYVGNDPVNMVDLTGEAGKVAWLINLGASVTRKVARITQQQAINIRQSGGNFLADSRQMARQIETAAHGKDNLLKHKGHELPDGSMGKPHFQTDGSKGIPFGGLLLQLYWALLIFLIRLRMQQT